MLPNCQMNETKLEVSESYEETELSDIDDDIFVRTGGRNGFRLEFSDTSKKPLMTPRKKKNSDHLVNGFHTEVRSSPPALRVLCMPICYIIVATFAMLGLIAVIAFLSHYISVPNILLKLWKKSDVDIDVSILAPCDNIQVEDVWVKQFPKLITESAFRMVDVNGDGIEDILFGFATGADGYNVPKFVCDIYFPNQFPCFGGVIALNGNDGSEIWRYWTAHEVFALNCNEDINQDKIPDCLVSGRAGVFCAISGRDGTALWIFSDNAVKNSAMNIYTAQFVRDLNGDGVLDVLAIHGGDPLAEPGSRTRLAGRILLLNGKNGRTLQWVETPDHQESYYSPQVLTKLDGSDWVLFGTGGETHPGGLYVISMEDLLKGFSGNVKTIYKDDKKGIMVPPVITDVNKDGVFDIVMAMFNSTVIAFDGNTFLPIWNHTFPSSETYMTPTPGYFNEDTVPDFLVKYQAGPGFPVYYHAQTTVLDGRNGNSLLQKPIMDSIGSQASTPLIRVQGLGNDIFLYWSSNCKGYEGNSTQYTFAKGTTVHEQSRSDFCKLRFDSTFVNQLHAFNQATGLPGFLIYDSELRDNIEHDAAIDTASEGQAFLQKHPEMWQYVGQDATQQEFLDTQNPKGAMINGDINSKEQKGRQILPEPFGPSDKMSASRLQFMNLPYNIPASQPELPENVKYPLYHTVRKHGGGKYLSPANVNAAININRRGQLHVGEAGINSRRRQLSDTQVEQGEKFSAPNDGDSYDTNGEDDIKNRRYGYQVNRNKPAKADTTYSQWGYNGGFNGNYNGRKRTKRHIGPHDMDGIQRLISTGTLAKPLNASSLSTDAGIDLIFATYWFYPAKAEAILLKSPDCIQKKMLEETLRFDESSKYYGMDHDTFEDAATNDCKLSSDPAEQSQSDSPGDGDNNIYESQSTYNPFDIHMGQMTVYRLHISCSCESVLASKKGESKMKRRCAKILGLEDQSWSGYMGSNSDSYFPSSSRRVKANPLPV